MINLDILMGIADSFCNIDPSKNRKINQIINKSSIQRIDCTIIKSINDKMICFHINL